MMDQKKTKKQLMDELAELRRRVGELSEANLSALIENTNDGICSVDSEYRILTVNKAFKKVFLRVYGVELEKGMKIIEWFPAERRSFWAEIHDRALKGGHFTFEDHHDPEGLSVHLEVSTNPIIGQDGTVTRVSYFIRDITERKRAEETLRESQELYRSLFEGVPVGLYRIMPGGEILDANTALVEMLGYPNRDSLLVVNLGDLFANPEERAWCREEDMVAHDFEAQFRRYDGRVIWIRNTCRAIPSDEGQVLYYEGAVQDITGHKRAEEALKESEETARHLSQENAIMAEIGRIISSTLDIDEVYERFAEKVREIVPFDRIAVNTINPRDHSTTISYATGLDVLERRRGDVIPLVGTLSEEVVRTRRNILIQIEDMEKVTDRFSGGLPAFQAGLRSLMAIPLISKDEVMGVLHFESAQLNTYGQKDLSLAEKVGHQIAGAIANAQLFVERKQAEEELRSSRGQLRALSVHLQSIREEERTLIAREIHDELGQELTGLKMDLSWLAKRLPADQEPLVEKVESMSKLVDTTIQSVRRISTKLRPGVLDDLGLIAAIEWQAQDFQNRTGIECEYNSNLRELDLDRDRSTTIFRILQETLTNVARHAGASRVTVCLKGETANIVLIVEDDGRGITEPEISDPKSLGLLGMRERALTFGGEVKIIGVPEKRTTVTLRIPLRWTSPMT